MEDLIRRYLENAIASEKSFETQLEGFANEAVYDPARMAFSVHAAETRQQYELLTTRLQTLGGEPSALKSALAHVLNAAPKLAQIGYSDEERTVQDLMMAFAVENAEVAMYESLVIAAGAFEDPETASLAKEIQSQERATAEKVWQLIAPLSREAFLKAQAGSKRDNPLATWIEDAEAAERNFEDALSSFSDTGDQPEIQSLFLMMSRKAATQHERLENRLREIGGSPSTTKSILAHLLAFAPLTARAGYSDSEKTVQNLMVVYSAAAAEMAMYESLASAADAAGDAKTAQLARELQSEEKEDHTLAWDQLGPSARHAMMALVH
jgi:ferritin-like metal-binding protein YciE